jgi:hypothetical protein
LKFGFLVSTSSGGVLLKNRITLFLKSNCTAWSLKKSAPSVAKISSLTALLTSDKEPKRMRMLLDLLSPTLTSFTIAKV